MIINKIQNQIMIGSKTKRYMTIEILEDSISSKL